MLRKKISTIDISLFSSVIVCLIGGTMFIQRYEWWNTSQFLDYPKIILSLYTALGIAQFLKNQKKVVRYILAILIVVFTMYNSIDGFLERVSFRSSLVLSNNQINAMSFLKSLPSGHIFALPFDRFSTTKSIKVEDNIDTVFVPVFAYKEMYYSTPYLLDLASIQYSDRKKLIESNLFTHPEKINTEYFYLIKSNPLFNKVQFTYPKFLRIFENNEVVIFRKS